jgi:Rieske Fe-S protein
MTALPLASRCDRRGFVGACALAAVSVAFGGCASLVMRRVTPVNGRLELALSHYPELSERDSVLTVLPEGTDQPVFVVTDAGGAHTALSSTCTHLGCTVELGSTHLVCPCHGSTFDKQGRVVRGPAENPLPRYRTQLTTDGVLIVDLRNSA